MKQMLYFSSLFLTAVIVEYLLSGDGVLMAAVLGLRGSGDFSDEERPTNYRELILLLYPNSPVSITALLSKLKVEATDDPQFTIFTKGLPTQTASITGAHSAAVTTLNFSGSSPAKVFRKGHAVVNERTLEVMWTTSDPSGSYDLITVSRGKGSTAAAMVDGDVIRIVGSSHQEGASVPTSITYDPSTTVSYTQIFRTSLDVTGTQKATHVRTGDDYLERQREALELHAIEREMAYIFGTGVEDTTGAQPQRTTKGFLSLVTTNVTDFADAVDIDTWESFLEDCFEDGSNEKLFLAGNSALTTINKIGRVHGQIEMTPRSESYGMQMQTYITAYGTLQLRQHALFSKSTTFKDWGLVVDPKYLVDRPLIGNGEHRDTHYRDNVQSPGDDRVTDEWLTEIGLELEHETVHGVAKNMSALVP